MSTIPWPYWLIIALLLALLVAITYAAVKIYLASRALLICGGVAVTAAAGFAISLSGGVPERVIVRVLDRADQLIESTRSEDRVAGFAIYCVATVAGNHLPTDIRITALICSCVMAIGAIVCIVFIQKKHGEPVHKRVSRLVAFAETLEKSPGDMNALREIIAIGKQLDENSK